MRNAANMRRGLKRVRGEQAQQGVVKAWCVWPSRKRLLLHKSPNIHDERRSTSMDMDLVGSYELLKAGLLRSKAG